MPPCSGVLEVNGFSQKGEADNISTERLDLRNSKMYFAGVPPTVDISRSVSQSYAETISETFAFDTFLPAMFYSLPAFCSQVWQHHQFRFCWVSERCGEVITGHSHPGSVEWSPCWDDTWLFPEGSCDRPGRPWLPGTAQSRPAS